MQSRSRRRPQHSGFILLMSLLVLTGLMTLATIGLMRSTTELLATSRFINSQQAFHLAEAGFDAKLRELATNNTNPIPNTPFLGGEYEVTVTPLADNTWQFDSIGRAGSSTEETLRLTVQRIQKLPTLGAVTIVGEGTAGVNADFSSGAPKTQRIEGCDPPTAPLAQCLPGSTVTTDTAFNNFKAYIDAEDSLTTTDDAIYNLTSGGTTASSQGYFGSRLHGAASDLGDFLPNGRYITPGDYSLHRAAGDEQGNLGYDLLNDLAAWAKTESQKPANDCYFNDSNDDAASGKKVVLLNKTLGTVEQPKICYAEYDFRTIVVGGTTYYDQPANSDPSWDIIFDGTTSGAGLLVVKGELDTPTTNLGFTYKGLIVIVGPSGELETRGPNNIMGAVLMGTTAPLLLLNRQPAGV